MAHTVRNMITIDIHGVNVINNGITLYQIFFSYNRNDKETLLVPVDYLHILL